VAETLAYWRDRDPGSAIGRLEGKHRMALVFRWYLGKSSRWAIAGETGARPDFRSGAARAMGRQPLGQGSFLETRRSGASSRSRSTCSKGRVVTRAHVSQDVRRGGSAERFHFVRGGCRDE